MSDGIVATIVARLNLSCFGIGRIISNNQMDGRYPCTTECYPWSLAVREFDCRRSVWVFDGAYHPMSLAIHSSHFSLSSGSVYNWNP